MPLENAEAENRQAVETLQGRIDAVRVVINEARAKYTYFLLASAGACLGYGLQKLDGQPHDYLAILAIAAYLLWMLSILFGCLGLQNSHMELNYGYRVLEIALKQVQPSSEPRDIAAIEVFLTPVLKKWGAEVRSLHWWQRQAQFYCLVVGVLCFAAWRLASWWCHAAP